MRKVVHQPKQEVFTMRKIIERFPISYGGFTINEIWNVDYHMGHILDGDNIMPSRIIDQAEKVGYKDTTFGLVCKNLESYKKLRSHLIGVKKAIGIVSDDDYDTSVILIYCGGEAVEIMYKELDIIVSKRYDNFDPYEDIPVNEWRYLTVNSEQSVNKKCWSVMIGSLEDKNRSKIGSLLIGSKLPTRLSVYK